MQKNISILGIRGLPAAHGGFEAFAEKLSLHLVKNNWEVTVYCQEEGDGAIYEKQWKGIKLVVIPVKNDGSLGSIIFDWKSIIHATRSNAKVLTLGYNTAIFNIVYRIKGITNIINMDGLEWKRAKWSFPVKVWFYLNERIGCAVGNQLIADHPKIFDHLATRVSKNKITMIPYGAEFIATAEETVLEKFDLKAGNYAIVIARPEPENSILEIVKAFSIKKRNAKLLVLGRFDIENNGYHRKVFESASSEVIFPGAIYDMTTVNSLRFFARFYIHGHQVGGTNPSLVEALGAGSAVLAHDNKFNRWVAHKGGEYFVNEQDCAIKIDVLLSDNTKIARLKSESIRQFQEKFTWDKILKEYEDLLLSKIDLPQHLVGAKNRG